MSETLTTKEQIDHVLQEAWNAEQVPDYGLALSLYERALPAIRTFKESSNPSDQAALEGVIFPSLFFIFTFFSILLYRSS